MRSLKLSLRERKTLRNLTHQKDPSIDLRRAYALMWLAEDTPPGDVARRLCVSRQTLYHWIHHFQSDPRLPLPERLQQAPRSGRPPTVRSLITPLIAQVIDQAPSDFGLGSPTWTAKLLKDYLERRHGIEASRQSVSLVLERLHLLWKRPGAQLALRSPTWRQSKGGSNTGSGCSSAPSF